MFKVTVIRLKDILKYIAIIIAIYFFSKIVLKNTSNFLKPKEKVNFDINDFFSFAINSESLIVKKISNYDKDLENKKIDTDNKNEKILEIGSSAFLIDFNEKNEQSEKQEELQENIENKEEVSNIEQEEKIENVASTQIVTPNPIKESYDKEYNGVKIKNETDFELSDDILNCDNLKIDNKNIIIFHTHTCESYTQDQNYTYESTGNFRTIDLNYSVAKVGDVLEQNLKNIGFNVNHNKEYHDYPAYTGSYNRSLSTVKGILQNFNSDIIIDLHRDAIGSDSSYAPTVKIGEDYCAQLMFVMGTNGGGLTHPNWQSNLKFAVKIQQKANELYPNLFKPIILRNSRYNQHLGKAACIIEVGSTGNTLEQALNSMKYLTNVFNESLNK